jgi:hypothetical protein
MHTKQVKLFLYYFYILISVFYVAAGKTKDSELLGSKNFSNLSGS